MNASNDCFFISPFLSLGRFRWSGGLACSFENAFQWPGGSSKFRCGLLVEVQFLGAVDLHDVRLMHDGLHDAESKRTDLSTDEFKPVSLAGIARRSGVGAGRVELIAIHGGGDDSI